MAAPPRTLSVLPWTLPGCTATSRADPDAVCPATVPEAVATGWRAVRAADLGPSPPEEISVLLPMPAGLHPLVAAAAARSLYHHNARESLNLIVLSDLPALSSLLAALERFPRVHAAALDRLSDVPTAVALAAELLPRLPGFLVLEPTALVLGALAPLWRLLHEEAFVIAAPRTASLGYEKSGVALVQTASWRSLPEATRAAFRAPPPAARNRSLVRRLDGALEGEFGAAPLCWPGAWRRLDCSWGYAALEGVHSAVSHDQLGLLPAAPAAAYVLCTETMVHLSLLPLLRRRRAANGVDAAWLACACGGRVAVLAEPPPPMRLTWVSDTDAELARLAANTLGAPAAAHAFALANGSVRAVGGRAAAPPRPPPPCAGGVVPVVFPCHSASVEHHWLTRVLLRGCALREVCYEDLAQASEAAHAARAGAGGGEGEGAGGGGARAAAARLAGALCAGSVLVLQDAIYDGALALLASHGHAPSAFALVHIAHSFMFQPEAAAAAARYRAWRVAFRNNWFADADAPGAAHALDAAAARGEVAWYPLGLGPQWVRVGAAIAAGAVGVPRASRRAHLASFLGSTDKSDREPRLAALRAALEGSGVGTAMLQPRGTRTCYGFGCNESGWVEDLLQSATSLHLPGSSPDSGRLWESLEAGSVPLVVEDFGPGEEAVGSACLYGDAAARATRGALRPLEEALGAPLPFVVVREVAELRAVLVRLQADPEALDALQQRTREWWADVKRHYGARMQAALCDARSGDDPVQYTPHQA